MNCIYFNVPLEVCQANNQKRTGRELVPDKVITNMYHSFQFPKVAENFDHIYEVDKYGITKEVNF